MTARRVCLLTGAGGRFGAAFCQAYADRFDIAAVCRKRLPPVASQLQSYADPLGGPVPENTYPIHVIRADLAEDGQAERAVELALTRYGRIDLLIHAAVDYAMAPMLEGDKLLASAERTLAMNVVLPLKLATLIAHEFWRDRVAENQAANRNIINLSSTSGLRVYPGSGQSVYSAAKAAMNHLTAHMAAEFAGIGVRANVLAPNSFPSIIPTADVARAAFDLDAGTMTGKTLVLDRGGKRTWI